MANEKFCKLGIDIGSTTVKIALLDEENHLLFSDYERHFANIRQTLKDLIEKCFAVTGDVRVSPVITGSGGLTLAKHLGIPFEQEVVAVATSLQTFLPKTDVAIELGGEDAKIIYFENGNVEQRMNGVCAGGTGSFIDQMASLIQTDASGLNEYAKNYKSLYQIASRCGVFAKTDIQPLINEGRPGKIWRPRSSRPSSTRPSPAWPAASPFAATSPFWEAPCIFWTSCAKPSFAPCIWMKNTLLCQTILTSSPLWEAL